ncbi:hypothetical protein M4578_13220 [Salipiger sp. P9]|uniref:hypothetical protein n=1 Tax=Salipiger pentaromativorans TaxID=2943193 RepID=UPI002157B1CE|nr:hypothetical protein [Salipiger pentaromativorans]MCR8548792.1 hypothetical protein [Salipiger pentaromativorans]
MRHAYVEATGPAMRVPEWRVVQMLRQHERPDRLEAALADVLGPARARYCLDGFARLLALLRQHGWHAPLILPPGAQGVSDDERSLARFVLLAAEQDRDLALAEAATLVTPQAILPLVAAGERMGLPLLCEECRDRLRCPLTFQ